MRLRPFQKDFLRGALAPSITTAALSIPRGNGKSWLAAYILARCLTPGDELFKSGQEYVLCSGSLEQARIVFKIVREMLGETEYRFLDSSTRLGITHTPSNTKLKVFFSNGKTAMGIQGCLLLVADEGGSWETTGGQLMFDAIQTSQGKPNSPLKAIYVGTLAPSTGGWWHDLVNDGSKGSTYVMSLQGDPATWDTWATINSSSAATS